MVADGGGRGGSIHSRKPTAAVSREGARPPPVGGDTYARLAEQSETYLPPARSRGGPALPESIVFFGVKGRVMSVLCPASSDSSGAVDAVLGLRLH